MLAIGANVNLVKKAKNFGLCCESSFDTPKKTSQIPKGLWISLQEPPLWKLLSDTPEVSQNPKVFSMSSEFKLFVGNIGIVYNVFASYSEQFI